MEADRVTEDKAAVEEKQVEEENLAAAERAGETQTTQANPGTPQVPDAGIRPRVNDR